MIAAVSENGVIGAGGSMPWHLPEDLQQFKETTIGGTLIMGRATWDSIGRALPGRRSIVVTRQSRWAPPGAEAADSLDSALAMVDDEEVFIVGGGTIYAQMMDHADRLLISHVDGEFDGDVFFPRIDPALWEEAQSRAYEGFTVREWVRRAHTRERPHHDVTAAPG